MHRSNYREFNVKTMAGKGQKNGAKAPAVQARPPRATKVAAPVRHVTPKPVAPKSVTADGPAITAQPVVAQAPVTATEPRPVAAKPVETSVPVKESVAPAVTNTATQTAETPKETHVMATQFEAPKVFADMNDRAKAAFEKSGKMVEEFNDFAKGNVEAIVESSRITAKGFESIGQEAAEYGRKSFEGFTATLKNLATVKSPADFFKLQSDYIRASFDSAVAEASKGTETMIKLAGDAAQPLSNRFAVAAEKVKTVA